MDFFGVVCFVRDIDVITSGSLTLFEKRFGMNIIMGPDVEITSDR